MPEADEEGKKYQIEQPQLAPGFYLKGSHQLDWGMNNRLARVFETTTGRTVLRALDHAIITAPEKRDPQLVAKLDAVAGRVLNR